MRHELIFNLSGQIGHTHARVNQLIRAFCEVLLVDEDAQRTMGCMADDLFEYMRAVMESSSEEDSNEIS